MILLIDNYDSFTYNLAQLLSALGAEVEVVRNDAVSAADAIASHPSGVVISPGPRTPAEAGVSSEVVRAAADEGVPVLGVCLGHQVIAEAFGGTIGKAPKPVHGKTDRIDHDGAGLFTGVANPMTATRYHSLCVRPESIAPPLVVQATSADGVVQGIRHQDLPVFGVQFHPESVLTPEGARLLANFLDVCGEVPLSQAPSHAAAAVAAAGGSARSSARLAEVTTVEGAIARVSEGDALEEPEAERVMGIIMDGKATPSQISALIVALRMKGETVDEIVGFARAMRDRATPVRPRSSACIDTCGTGGDGLHTFNVSTATAFVVAGCGVPVAKHGNRAVSSSAGSADVLEALGVDITIGPDAVARCIDECGVGFLFAQSLHASMRHAGPTRREIGIRTVFNILGPLTNPAGAKRQLLGVYDPRLAPVLAEVSGRLGSERTLVVNGHPGMDEVSASGPTTVADYDALCGEVRAYTLTPEEVGIERSSLADIAGGDGAANARRVRSVLEGERGPARDVVVMNSAAALTAAGAVEDMAEGVAAARASIDSGRAMEALERLVEISKRLGGGA